MLNNTWKQNEIQASGSISKVMLEASVCFHIAYGCFHATMAKLNSCDRDSMAHKT